MEQLHRLVLLLVLLLASARGQTIMPPSPKPSSFPSPVPTKHPSAQPTMSPTAPSPLPSPLPSQLPTPAPSVKPTAAPTRPSPAPTAQPSVFPTAPSPRPSPNPTRNPTFTPSSLPTRAPSPKPTLATPLPTALPSAAPTAPSPQPSPFPTYVPTLRPTALPTQPSASPTLRPTSPTGQPTRTPSSQPSGQPSVAPTKFNTTMQVVSASVVLTGVDKASLQRSSDAAQSAIVGAVLSTLSGGIPNLRGSMLYVDQFCSQIGGVGNFTACSPPVATSASRRLRTGSDSDSGSASASSRSLQQAAATARALVKFHIQFVAGTLGSTTATSLAAAVASGLATPGFSAALTSGAPAVFPAGVTASSPLTSTSRAAVSVRSPTRNPSRVPTLQPTGQPTRQPTSQPTRQPSGQPTGQPSRRPSRQPTAQPTGAPTIWQSRSPTLYPNAVLNTPRPSTQPTATPSAHFNATHEDGGPGFNSTGCPFHGFLPGVRVECQAVRGTADWTDSSERIKAASTVDFKLSYEADAPGYNANDDEPLLQPRWAPPLFIDIPSFIPDDVSDFSTFVVDQSSSSSSSSSSSPSSIPYEDRLVGVALDGVPIYTALGPGGADLLSGGGGGGGAGHLHGSRYAVDSCGGSYGPTPHGERYHYRTIPACVLTPLGMTPRGYQDRRRVYVDSVHELLAGFEGTAAMQGPVVIGWALTGHPIFSPFTPRGLLQTGLDNCNGKIADTGSLGLRTVSNDTRTYGFYASPTFPYLVGCFGPGAYALAEQNAATLEALAANTQGRKFDACPQGYVPDPAFASSGCVPCPAGRYSTASYARPGSAGAAIAKAAATGCAKQCPVGFFCPPASTKPRKCPAGRFGSSTGLGDAACSGECQAGFFCPAASASPRAFVCGNESFFCPPASADRLPVDAGFYTVPETSLARTPADSAAPAASARAPDADDSTRVGQRQCGPGTFCLHGLRMLCPAGVYGDAPGLASPACSAPCPAGAYCPIGSAHPTLCPAGSFGAVPGLGDAACSGLCQPGYWCPAGSTSPNQVPCKPGRYGAEAGLATEHCSPLCEPFGAPNATDSGGTRFCEARACQAGYVCPAASTSATQAVCGGPAVYCPPHSVVPTAVSPGFYSLGAASVPHQAQVAADAATRFSQAQCEPGYYCVGGVRSPCAPGRYGATPGLSSADCSGLCAPGFLCGLASTSPTQALCSAGPGQYCPLGSFAPIDVPSGNYSTNGTLTSRSDLSPCPPGAYCQGGVQIACPAGRFSASGAASPLCDGLCAAGFYCLEGSTSPQQFPCPAGRYGIQGMANSRCMGQCLAGYYCPQSSTTPYERECGDEGHFCPPGSAAPQAVAAGSYSSGQNATIRVRADACRLSPYYSAQPSGHRRLFQCPTTTV